jgi:Protein ChrB, N-terminal
MSMDADGRPASWLLLLTQLPRAASSPRVALWRRLRAAGATTMVSSVWVLPETAPHAELFEQLRDGLLRQGGIGFVLSIPAATPEVNEAVVSRFRADRAREYDEFAERCAALLAELGKEGKAGKYTFAELEESEQDLEKLVRWLAKIQARDFFPDERGKEAASMLARCQAAVEAFSQSVYTAEGVTGAGGRGPQAPGGAGNGQLDSIQPV